MTLSVLYVCCVSSSGAMLEGYSPVTQALLGTLFTWGLTAAGSALVFVFSSRQVTLTELQLTLDVLRQRVS